MTVYNISAGYHDTTTTGSGNYKSWYDVSQLSLTGSDTVTLLGGITFSDNPAIINLNGATFNGNNYEIRYGKSLTITGLFKLTGGSITNLNINGFYNYTKNITNATLLDTASTQYYGSLSNISIKGVRTQQYKGGFGINFGDDAQSQSTITDCQILDYTLGNGTYNSDQRSGGFFYAIENVKYLRCKSDCIVDGSDHCAPYGHSCTETNTFEKCVSIIEPKNDTANTKFIGGMIVGSGLSGDICNFAECYIRFKGALTSGNDYTAGLAVDMAGSSTYNVVNWYIVFDDVNSKPGGGFYTYWNGSTTLNVENTYVYLGGTIGSDFGTIFRGGTGTITANFYDLYSNEDLTVTKGGGTVSYGALEINGSDQGSISTYNTTGSNTSNFTNTTIPAGWSTNSVYYSVDPGLQWTAGGSTNLYHTNKAFENTTYWADYSDYLDTPRLKKTVKINLYKLKIRKLASY